MTPDATADSRALVVAPLETFRAGVETVVDLLEFIDENKERIGAPSESFVRVAKRSHSEKPEDRHRQAFALYSQYFADVRAARAKAVDAEEKERVTNGLEDRLRDAILELTGDPDDYWRYWQVWQDVNRRPNELFLLSKSLLITLVSDFEVLVSSVIKAQLQLRPEILRASEQKYSLADVSSFSSLEEFKESCTENIADSVMRGGFDEWVKWFAGRHKLAISSVTVDNDELVEVFQRRHLLVHAGGVVNAQYLSRCCSEQGEGAPEKGEVLRVSRKYLQRATQVLLSCGIKLMGSMANSVADVEARVVVGHTIARHLAYEMLKSGQAEVVREVLEWYLPMVSDEADRLTCQVNLWIARKDIDGIESIREEVESWDTSVLADRYKLAKSALLDRNEEAYHLVETLTSSGDITVQDWNEWPLLKRVRRYEAEEGKGPISQPLDFVEAEVPSAGEGGAEELATGAQTNDQPGAST